MKFHIKYLLLICVLLAGASFNSVWAVDVTIISENFNSGSASGWNISGKTSWQGSAGAKSLQLASSSGSGQATTPAFSTLVGTTATLTFKHKSSGSANRTLTITGNNCKVDGKTSTTITATSSQGSSIIYISEASTSSTITFSASKDAGTLIDDVVIYYTADPRTAVNILSFSATNTTLIVGGSPNTTTTSVTNDQPGWTAAYTYTSSNEGVATVNSSGVITAVAKGTAIITCSLNVDNDDPDYKAGSTTSKTVEITVNKPSHTVTFSVNGSTTRTAIVEEDQPITFPTAVETPSVASEFPEVINGMTFVGWYSSTYSHATDAPSYVNTASTNMGTGDVTYYAVYAEENTSDGVIEKSFSLSQSELTEKLGGSYGSASIKKTIDDVDYTINMYACKQSSKCQLRASDAYIKIPTLPGNIINVSTTGCYNTSDGKYSGTIRLKSAQAAGSSSSYDIVTKDVSSSNSFSIDVTGNVKSLYLTTSAGLRLANLTVHYEVDGTVTTYKNYSTMILGLPIPVTLNASGYATFCSEYPLDFSDYATSDYSAWQITGVDGESITFSQITGSIKGGQGILLKGEASDEIILTNANSATVLSDNFLVGTVAPMSISADEYYGLSGNKFVKVNAGTVPAGKALLPASAISASARELKFVFEGDETTSITENLELRTENAVYDLQGRKVTKPVKGGLYIVNGRKFINK